MKDETGKTEPPKQPMFLNVRQACELAGFSRPTWYKLLENRTTGLYKVVYPLPDVRRVLICRDDLIAWLRRRHKVL